MVKYIKWLLPVLFIAYYSSVSLFTHVHVEPWYDHRACAPFQEDGGRYLPSSYLFGGDTVVSYALVYSRDGRGDSPVTFTILFFKNI